MVGLYGLLGLDVRVFIVLSCDLFGDICSILKAVFQTIDLFNGVSIWIDNRIPSTSLLDCMFDNFSRAWGTIFIWLLERFKDVNLSKRAMSSGIYFILLLLKLMFITVCLLFIRLMGIASSWLCIKMMLVFIKSKN